MTGFCFDTAKAIAITVLARWKAHRDFDDLVSETVIAAWKASEKRPDVDLPLAVTCAAQWQVKEWFRSKRCGDLMSGDRRQRVSVQPVPWTAAVETSAVVADFSEAVVERLSAPAIVDEKERWADWLTECDLMSHYREAARLHYCEGWPMRKVAEHLGLCRPSIYEAIRNSRRRMERISR